MMNLILDPKALRRVFCTKYARELAERFKCETKEIEEKGLSCLCFPHNVYLIHEDGSIMDFQHAFFVENKVCYAVFTEHCGYYEYMKNSIETIYNYTPDYSSHMKNQKIT